MAAVSADAEGQQPASAPGPWSAAVRIGFSSPKGDLGDMGDDGLLLGASLDRRVSDRLRIGAEATLESLVRGGRPGFLGGSLGPSIEQWRVLAVAGYELTDPGASPWELALHPGAGGTWVDAGASEELASYEDLDPMATTGLCWATARGRTWQSSPASTPTAPSPTSSGTRGPGGSREETTLIHTEEVPIRL